MSGSLPLIDHVALLLERTYDFDSGLLPLGRFVVGEQGRERLLGGRQPRQRVDGGDGAACLLLRPPSGAEAQWAAALYLPEKLVEDLERADPRRELHGGNLGPFATLVEEVDHLLTFADRALRPEGMVSLLELEWHAAVSKHLTLSHFAGRLASRRRLQPEVRRMIDHHLFHRGPVDDPDASVVRRYARAESLARAFVGGLRGLAAADRLRRLRRFHRANHFEKLRRFA
ncbi:MAG: hypothetical protein Q9Q40_14310 [Acidobacteriota bacterium]|nr:hypothetical protein [Acidobacteriota bacterium]MDQ7087700.1 hypothetical protein [Acidobacteriota bacterium]